MYMLILLSDKLDKIKYWRKVRLYSKEYFISSACKKKRVTPEINILSSFTKQPGEIVSDNCPGLKNLFAGKCHSDLK